MLKIVPDKILIENYNYKLPNEKIAKFPISDRDKSRLLLYNKGELGESVFSSLPEWIEPGGLMVFNNTKVIRARIIMHKSSGAKIELFLLEPSDPPDYNIAFSAKGVCRWKCTVGNKKRWKGGNLIKSINSETIKTDFIAKLVEDNDLWQEIEFSWSDLSLTFLDLIEAVGIVPIPPYLQRLPVDSDSDNYQTVYAKWDGSVAAPTAGLHFTPEVLNNLKERGCKTSEITLHVGAGTFRPVKSASAAGHSMHSEHFVVTKKLLKEILQYEGNITAVGTTTVRTLESLYWIGVKLFIKATAATATAATAATSDTPTSTSLTNTDNNSSTPTSNIATPSANISTNIDTLTAIATLNQWDHIELQGDIGVKEAIMAVLDYMETVGVNELVASTELMITPGYRFRIINRLITNFHQPGSTLLLLIAALIGDEWLNVYRYALENGFRFLSYGDSSLLIPKNPI